MKSNAELTPVERLLKVCSLCLSPPIIMQMPWEQDKACLDMPKTHSYCNYWISVAYLNMTLVSTVMQLIQSFNWIPYWVHRVKWIQLNPSPISNVWTFFMYVKSSKMWHKFRLAHRDEEDASEQRASQCWFNHLLQTWVGCLVPSEQGGDVKRQLCDGAKAGVHHCTHSKVTLGWDTEKIRSTLYENLYIFKHSW